MQQAPNFLNEVIPAFGSRDGLLSMRRGDVFTLAIELGWSRRVADTVAFSSMVKAIDDEPMSIDEARALLAADRKAT